MCLTYPLLFCLFPHRRSDVVQCVFAVYSGMLQLLIGWLKIQAKLELILSSKVDTLLLMSLCSLRLRFLNSKFVSLFLLIFCLIFRRLKLIHTSLCILYICVLVYTFLIVYLSASEQECERLQAIFLFRYLFAVCVLMWSQMQICQNMSKNQICSVFFLCWHLIEIKSFLCNFIDLFHILSAALGSLVRFVVVVVACYLAYVFVIVSRVLFYSICPL